MNATLFPRAVRSIEALSRRIGPLGLVRRHLAVFSAVFALVVGLTLLAFVLSPTRYVATGSIIVAEPEPGLTETSPSWAQKIGDPADLESQLLVIRSPRVLRLAISRPEALAALADECRMTGASAFGGNCETLTGATEALVAHVQTRYAIGSAGRSRVINISYAAPDPDVAQRMANALITTFLEDQKQALSAGRKVAAEWLWKELDDLDRQIRAEDKDIEAYRAARGLINGATAPISSERLSNVNQQLTLALAAEAQAAARLAEVEGGEGADGGATSAVLSNRTIADLKQQISALGTELAAARALLGPMHPRLKVLQQQIGQLNTRLTGEIDRLSASARKDYDTAAALVVSLKAQLDSVKAEVAEAVSGEATIENRVRALDNKRKQYADLYEKASALETEQRILIGSTRLVSLAERPLKPNFPKKAPFLAAGLTVALIAAYASAFASARLAATRRAVAAPAETPAAAVAAAAPPVAAAPPPPPPPVDPEDDIVEPADLPVVARLPFLRASLLGNGQSLRALLAIGTVSQPMQAALDDLDDAILAAVPRRDHGAVVLVSALAEGAGRSMTVLALARQVAASGRRVLVVEAAQARPVLATALGLRPAFTLDAALARGQMPETAVMESPVAGLEAVVTERGFPRPGPAMEEALAGFVAWSRKYDLVLIDGPLAGTAALATLAPHCDAVLLCVPEAGLDPAGAARRLAGGPLALHPAVGLVATLAGAGRVENRPPEVA